MNDNKKNSGLDIIVSAINEAGIDIMNEPSIPTQIINLVMSSICFIDAQ